ncbi:MAG: mannose-1-phosphate guanylyltransferase [Bacteroidales bacterium]|nr:mannose-1-phosphate guanylyltransferase [Bacteroidales bacterium]
MERYCVIMAGGIGSRFWPLSTEACPKQFIDILGKGKSFIRATFERFRPLVPDEHFLVVTNAAYKQQVLQHLPELSEEQVLCEPMRRNTATCIAYAAYRIAEGECHGNRAMVVTPADHYVTDEDAFRAVIARGFDFVEAHPEALTTIGICPTRPETGYGYIEQGAPSGDNAAVWRVAAFKEKPDHAHAMQFLAAGNYMWNSGIFLWSVQAYQRALQQYLPAMRTIFRTGDGIWNTPSEQQWLETHYPQCENISVDYGILEKSDSCYMLRGDFGWSDVGTWGSLYEHASKDGSANATAGEALLVDSNRCVVNVEPGTQAIVQGLDGYLVAMRGGQLLVCSLREEQHIKDWVAQLSCR